MREDRAETRRTPELLPAVALAVLLVIPELVWIGLDNSQWRGDPLPYGSGTIDLYATLRFHPGDWLDALFHVYGYKAPGIGWLGQFFVPLHSIVGSYERALLLSIAFCQAGSIALLYVTARRLGSSTTASVAAVLCLAGAPLFVTLGHEYYTEPLQTLCVTWVLFVMASARRWRPAITLGQLAGAISLAVVAKFSSPAYIAPPAALAAYFAFQAMSADAPPRSPFWRDWRAVSSAAIGCVLAIGAIGWYSNNFEATREFAQRAAGHTGFGEREPFLAKSLEWLQRMSDAVFIRHVAMVVLLALVVGCVIARRRGRLRLRAAGRDIRVAARPLLPYLACVLPMLIVLVLLSTNVNEDPRFVSSLTPFTALLLAGLISATRSEALARAAVVVLLVQFGFVNFGSGVIDGDRSSRLWPSAPVRSDRAAEAIDRLARSTCTADAAGRVNLINFWTASPAINSRSLDFAARKAYSLSDRRCVYRGLNLNSSPRLAWRQLRESSPPFFIAADTVDRGNLPPGGIQFGNPNLPPPAGREVGYYRSAADYVLRRALASGKFSVKGPRTDGLVVLQARARDRPAGPRGTPS